MSVFAQAKNDVLCIIYEIAAAVLVRINKNLVLRQSRSGV